MVKWQAIDIADVIFSLIWRRHLIHTGGRNRKSALRAALTIGGSSVYHLIRGNVGFFCLSTGRCLVDSSLELEHLYLKLAPRSCVPFIPMIYIMAHDVLTLLVDSTFVITVPLWAYPLHYQGLWLRGRSLPSYRLRVCVCLLRFLRAVGASQVPV